MIPLKEVIVFSFVISVLIFTPSYSFAQNNQNDNFFSSFFEIFAQFFSFEDENFESVTEFIDETKVQPQEDVSREPIENNIPPEANAGINQTVLEFANVTLDGSSSTDVDGTIVSYKWNQFSGADVVLSSITDPSPNFIAPEVDVEDILKFLEVSTYISDFKPEVHNPYSVPRNSF